jgi:hypothetical protein
MDEIERKAREVISDAEGYQLTLVGQYVNSGQSPDQSPVTFGWCSSCGIPIQSTMVKDKILQLTAHLEFPAEIRCPDCLRMLVAPDNEENRQP